VTADSALRVTWRRRVVPSPSTQSSASTLLPSSFLPSSFSLPPSPFLLLPHALAAISFPGNTLALIERMCFPPLQLALQMLPVPTLPSVRNTASRKSSYKARPSHAHDRGSSYRHHHGLLCFLERNICGHGSESSITPLPRKRVLRGEHLGIQHPFAVAQLPGRGGFPPGGTRCRQSNGAAIQHQ